MNWIKYPSSDMPEQGKDVFLWIDYKQEQAWHFAYSTLASLNSDGVWIDDAGDPLTEYEVKYITHWARIEPPDS